MPARVPRIPRRRRGPWFTAFALILVASTWFGGEHLLDLLNDGASERVAASSHVSDRFTGRALAADLLEDLEVKGRSPRTGYSREQFGRAWVDADRNGCDTRNDILLRDLHDTTVDERCRILSGVLDDPFTGRSQDFVRGERTSQEVQIDHVVALSDAWQKGAQALSRSERIAFANDPRNLLAVNGAQNQAKGDADAASWLPPNRGFRCEYVAIQISVKHAYDLWITEAERNAMHRVLDRCPGQRALGEERSP